MIGSIVQWGRLSAARHLLRLPCPTPRAARLLGQLVPLAAPKPGPVHVDSRQASSKRQAKQPPQHPLRSQSPKPVPSRQDQFYAESAADFQSLGLSLPVCEGLKAAGYTRPSRVQELAVPAILSGRDVVLAAETGSGKTLAYLTPLATALLEHASGFDEEERSFRKHLALVLCPNTALCQQVVAAASALLDTSGQPLLRACHVSSSSPPPFQAPDVVVATPGGLLSLLKDKGYNFGQLWSEAGLGRRVAHVVVDEADLLITGGYIRDLTRLLDMLKSGERRLVEQQVARELGLELEQLAALPRPLKMAMWEAGVPGLLREGFRLPPGAAAAAQATQQESSSSAAASSSSSGEADEEEEEGSRADRQRSQEGASSSSSRRWASWWGPYFSRQYVFVAATMPSVTKSDVGTELQKRYKDATWIRGDMLHKSKPEVQHTWLEVDDESWEEALVNSIREDADYQQQRARILVFARDITSTDRVCELLSAAAIPHLPYHKSVPLEEREAALQAMAAPDGNAVLVSTDAAARGIDLPGVTHVIQADFVTAAVDFLHRIGRTARAGKGGKVTSLYRGGDAALAEVLQSYIQQGKPVEDCFSRNRSFKKKIKRYNQFVPRGKQGPGGR